MVQSPTSAAIQFPVEGEFPSLGGATNLHPAPGSKRGTLIAMPQRQNDCFLPVSFGNMEDTSRSRMSHVAVTNERRRSHESDTSRSRIGHVAVTNETHRSHALALES